VTSGELFSSQSGEYRDAGMAKRERDVRPARACL